jgi:hypothetical protein
MCHRPTSVWAPPSFSTLDASSSQASTLAALQFNTAFESVGVLVLPSSHFVLIAGEQVKSGGFDGAGGNRRWNQGAAIRTRGGPVGAKNRAERERKVKQARRHVMYRSWVLGEDVYI